MLSAANSTAQILSSTDGSSATSQVSGPTVFWALLPLALNAMAQDSPTTRVLLFKKRGTKEGLLTPTLSSPIFCFADCCVDSYLIILAVLRFGHRGAPLTERSLDSGSRPQRIEPLVAVRILLIAFGVVTQAVRLYGMSGIPLTQVVATTYLATSLLRLLRVKLLPSVEEDEDEGDGDIAPGEWILTKIIGYFIFFFGLFILHLLAYSWLLDGFSQSFYTDRQNSAIEHLLRALIWSSIIVSMLCLLGTLLWIVCILFDIVRPLQRTRLLGFWVLTYILFWVKSLIMPTTEKTSRTFMEIFVDTPVVLAVAVASLLAVLLKFLLQMIDGRFKNTNNIDAVSVEMVDSQDDRFNAGPFQNDIESANPGITLIDRSDQTVASSTGESTENKIEDPLWKLQLHWHISFSLLVERKI